ncbi:helix-turn-helix domain-containing protein [Candidatus Halobeggiatoa sp. HSG11]|nr:helix-turn-helix domain-containing protein [Candidatus Halobeggiatoa sp. HSG11]
MKISDRRKTNFFIVDNQLFDVWGKELKPQGIAVYCCLIRHASSDSCYPSHATLAKECGLSKSTAIRTLKKLSELGLIRISKRHSEKTKGQTSNEYTILNLPPQCQSDTRRRHI